MLDVMIMYSINTGRSPLPWPARYVADESSFFQAYSLATNFSLAVCAFTPSFSLGGSGLKDTEPIIAAFRESSQTNA